MKTLMKYFTILLSTLLCLPISEGRPCDSVLLDYTYFQDAQGRFVLGGRLQLEVEEWTKITVELSTDVRMSECRTEVLSTERTSANTCAMDYVSIKNRKGRLMVEEPFQIYLEGAKQVYQTGVTSVKLNQVEQCNYSHREGRGMVIVLDDPDISLVSRAREEKTEVTPGQEEEEEDSGLLVILICCCLGLVLLISSLVGSYFVCWRERGVKQSKVYAFKDDSFENNYDNYEN